MKFIKNILVFIVFVTIIQLSTIYLSSNGMMWIVLFIIGFFFLNRALRNSLSFKNYFTSPYNITTAKNCIKKEIDIPKELLFEKLKEVINDSNFKLVQTDEERLEILATTSINPYSWGENIYLSFESIEENTILTIYSTTLFQRISWGKNKINFNNLLKQIDDSLTV
ncbi:hypothetical protein [Brumimicrobium mesophilum]|uniref:hypothetical protein n=1 Tax=Brumimicrobium mesophilum TaxID=392717 RepID=UPI000D141E8E|nr:hypothetical protein [Brumimicrobium mesophilum]